MAKKGSAWVCTVCGNGVMVIQSGKNPKVGCCGKAMKQAKLKIK